MTEKLSPEQSYAYAEILEILSFTHKSMVSKIPKKLIAIFNEYASSTYEHHLDRNIPIEDQDISQETASIIAILALNYWCESEEEKKEIKSLLSENEKKLNEELRQKYNPDNIFNNNSNHTQAIPQQTARKNDTTQNIHIESKIENNLPLDTAQLPWYKKVIIKFNDFFSKLLKKTNNPK